MLLRTWISKCFFKTLLSILLDICPETELLDHIVILFSISEELPYCYPKGLHHFIFLPIVSMCPSFSTSLPTLVFSLSLPLLTYLFIYLFIFDSNHPNGCEVECNWLLCIKRQKMLSGRGTNWSYHVEKKNLNIIFLLCGYQSVLHLLENLFQHSWLPIYVFIHQISLWADYNILLASSLMKKLNWCFIYIYMRVMILPFKNYTLQHLLWHFLT